MQNKYFTLVVTSFGAILVGEVYESDFENWKINKSPLVLQHPRRLMLGQHPAQANLPNSQVNVISIGPPYFGDTPQETLYLEGAALELIGKIEDKCCKENNQLYQQYSRAYEDWRMSRSGLFAPTSTDISNLTNISKFTKKG